LNPSEVTLIKAFAKGKRFFCGNRSSSLEFVDAKKWAMSETNERFYPLHVGRKGS